MLLLFFLLADFAVTLNLDWETWNWIILKNDIFRHKNEAKMKLAMKMPHFSPNSQIFSAQFHIQKDGKKKQHNENYNFWIRWIRCEFGNSRKIVYILGFKEAMGNSVEVIFKINALKINWVVNWAAWIGFSDFGGMSWNWANRIACIVHFSTELCVHWYCTGIWNHRYSWI